MKKIMDFRVSPQEGFDLAAFEAKVRQQLKATDDPNFWVRPLQRSVDARKSPVRVQLRAEVAWGEPPVVPVITTDYPSVEGATPVLVVGAGPGGIFAALRLIELGLKPVLVERGKPVRERTRDIANISRRHIVDPDSNYCFGEGGAGTFSDGKLYTRAKKRGSWQRVLRTFVAHGADPVILLDSQPHIGTNKLPRIVAQMRERILAAGGQVHFGAKVTEFLLDQGQMRGVRLSDGRELLGAALILATGHSARDIFAQLHRQQIAIAAKPFALGVRAEHPQAFVDRIQYHGEERGGYLPAAPYSLKAQVKERGVFSFCMCPGGFMVPSATATGEVVVNGMSPSKRNSRYANSGIVVSVDERDWGDYTQHGPLAAMHFQAAVEQRACQLAGNTQAAPAQRLHDFVARRLSSELLPTSYQPGLVSVEIDEVLPPQITQRLRRAFQLFDKKMKGYLTADAQIVGVESRTSSPVRIPRDPETGHHPDVQGLFPCGEGAGYAGGIASAAMDGERCAEWAAAFVLKNAPRL
ncbi:MAG: NAD(P)/FAD-dependent oxidoreductase [Bernardetiaceae bacterium]